MQKNLFITSILGLLAVILGAFGAHALKNSLTFEQLNSFETAIRYQFYHVIVLLFVNMYSGFSITQKNKISYFFFTGILCFSGSIYSMYLLNVPSKYLWFLTPFGGLLFIVGWFLMIIFLSKKHLKTK